MNFSFSWFKSRKQELLEDLKIEEQKLKNTLLSEKLENKRISEFYVKGFDLPAVEQSIQVCKSIKLVGTTLTVILNDGAILSKPDATYGDFSLVRCAGTESEILDIMISEEGRQLFEKSKLEASKVRAIQNNLKKLAQLNDFELIDKSLYLKGTSRSIPELLVNEFIDVIDGYDFENHTLDEIETDLINNDSYQALKNFFLWCCLNPRAEVANELYEFLKRNSFRITKQGFFVALRNVVRLPGNENPELVDFISNAYNKVKAVWKKKPDTCTIYETSSGYKLIYDGKVSIDPNWKLLGSLKDLYLDLPNLSGNRFTDDWTKSFDIRVGRPVNMPMEQCNWSTQDCAAAGLHFTSDQIHYVGCGDTSMLVLINPMKVVGIGQHKGRCYEYLPIMTVPRDEATTILHDIEFNTLELDEDYAIRELEGLADKVKEGFVAETSKYEFNLPSISALEITRIVSSLEEMKQVLSKRVSIIE